MSVTRAYVVPVVMPPDAGAGLSTARLTLRRYTSDDLPALVRLNSDPEVMRHLGGIASPEKTRTMLENRILHYYDANPGLGVWATLLRDSGECVGFHLLNHVQGETLIQVGYRLYRQHWGRGYATEMSMGLLHYGYAQLNLKIITANTELGNHASQHVLLKAGLHRVANRRFTHEAYAHFGEVASFERDAADWLAEFVPFSTDEATVAGVRIQ